MDYNEKVQYLKSYRDKCDRLEFIEKRTSDKVYSEYKWS